MARIEVDDVQGIVLRAYNDLPELSFILLSGSGSDPAPARNWLATLLPEVTSAAQTPQHVAVNVAFTRAGLTAFGLPAETLDGFAREFREDTLRDEHRNRVLGDVEESRPEKWAWGGPTGETRKEVHVALLLYAEDAPALARLYEKHE